MARLQAQLKLDLRTEAVDLVDLARANGLLRYHAARDGVVLFLAALRDSLPQEP